MTDKSNFTKEEWTLLLKSPMIAGMAVTAADPSGLWGLLKESFAGGAALTKAATDPNVNGLVKAVVTDFSTGEGRSAARDGLQAEFAGGKLPDIKTKSIDSLRQVSALLAAKAPDDATAFKDWLRSVSSADRGSGLRGRRSVRRRCSGQRRGKGDARRNLDCARRLIGTPE